MWIVYAILAAVGFGLRGVLYHWTSQRGLDRHLTLFGVFTTGFLVALAAVLASGQSWSLASLIGIGMGVMSFASNSSLYKGFAVGKASLVAILTGLTPAVVVLLARFFWGETLNAWQWLAFVALLVSIVMIRYSNDLSLRNLQGVQWGLLAMLFFAFNDLLGKQSAISGAEPYPTLVFMFSSGAALFGATWAASVRHAAIRAPSARRVSAMQASAAVQGLETSQASAAVQGLETSQASAAVQGSETSQASAADQISEMARASESVQVPAMVQASESDQVPVTAQGSAVAQVSATAQESAPARKSAVAQVSAAARLPSGGLSGWSNGRTFLWGMLVGLTHAWGMIFMLKAFAVGKAGLVSAIAAMHVLVILGYSRFVVNIPFKRLELAGMALAVAGMLLLRIAG